MPKLIIPARLSSKRLPKKPLIFIDGKPMIIRTAENAISVLGSDNVIVATDSEDIMNCCKDYGVKSIITSQNCLTGTDRVLEASKKLNLNEVYNLQGDEPLFPKEIIREFINQTLESNYPVDMGITKIENLEELTSPKIPKIVFNNKKELLYTSRAAIPGSKNMDGNIGYKQVCIYKYNIEKLVDLYKQKTKTFFESIEDLELLRMLEISITVKCRFLNYKEHFSVDTKEDLEKVIGFLKK
tara:strand:- start:3 stop:725 length:723 start_codon:yes stop_codon:yes gene_type:complete